MTDDVLLYQMISKLKDMIDDLTKRVEKLEESKQE